MKLKPEHRNQHRNVSAILELSRSHDVSVFETSTFSYHVHTTVRKDAPRCLDYKMKIQKGVSTGNKQNK